MFIFLYIVFNNKFYLTSSHWYNTFLKFGCPYDVCLLKIQGNKKVVSYMLNCIAFTFGTIFPSQDCRKFEKDQTDIMLKYYKKLMGHPSNSKTYKLPSTNLNKKLWNQALSTWSITSQLKVLLPIIPAWPPAASNKALQGIHPRQTWNKHFFFVNSEHKEKVRKLRQNWNPGKTAWIKYLTQMHFFFLWHVLHDITMLFT